VRLKRPLHGPSSPRGPSHGRDVKDFVKRTLWRLPAQIPVGADFFPKPPGGFDDVYNQKTADAVEVVQRFNDIRPTGNMGQATLDALWQYADAYSKWVYRLYVPPKPKPPVPVLGPIVAGGVAVSRQRLTHVTDGIIGYPAFDDGWVSGRAVIAPESLTITEQSGAQGGDAFYALGQSGIRYWVGHVVAAPATGRKFSTGATVAKIASLPAYQGGPHVHLGLNALALGVALEATGYGPGPTVDDQLRGALL
jgi:hypothetical protein